MTKNEFSVIKARHSHAEGICDVLIKSIKELCYADHNNDPTKLSDWLSNKTPENIRKWIKNPSGNFLVALHKKENSVIGVSMITAEGMILLNYVHPNYIRGGIGKSMLDALEKISKKTGLEKIMVSSTISALGFYKKNGFKEQNLLGKKNDDILLIKYLSL